jgi:hypothetical protein
MMKTLSHIISNHIFIFATSLAMLVHSTWTFGTLFSGKQPIIDGTIEQWISYLLWVTPALLVALAIDIGQIQTSVKLSNATVRSQKVTLGITFVTLALAGYYLQWFHLAHHIPALDFGPGLSLDMQSSLKGVKDIAIFVVPALLPLSTILYTLSSGDSNTETVTDTPQLSTFDINFPKLEPAIWKDDTQHFHVGDLDTEPYQPVTSQPSRIMDTQAVAMTLVVTANDSGQIHCEDCGKPITNARHNQKFCNAGCRQSSYRKRNQEAGE